MRKIIILGCSVLLAGCAVHAPKQEHFTPAVNSMPQATKFVVKEEVPVAMPGQLMKKPAKTAKKVVTKTGEKAVIAANKASMMEPDSNDYINSMMHYDYMSGALYQIYCAPLNVTDIVFQSRERIISVAAGDTLRWQVSKTFSGQGATKQAHLMIKPIDPNTDDSMVVTTNRRTYHFSMHSTPKTYMASVTFRYPDDQTGFITQYSNQADAGNANNGSLQGLSLDQLDFNYQTEVEKGGQPDWMPKMVFNDGTKTYIQFPARMQQSPTLFIGNNGGAIVNYRIEGNYYIVDGIYQTIQLRTGQKDPVIVQVTHG